MGATGATKAKIWDDATGDYLDILHISKESRFALTPIYGRGLAGNLVKEAERAELQLLFYDDLDAARLISWSKNQTKLNAVVFGIEDYIFWQEPATILTGISKHFKKGDRNARWLRMSVQKQEINVTMEPGYILTDENGNELEGFYGTNLQADSIDAVNVPPASVGSQDTFTWTISGTDYNIEYINLNTTD